MSPSDKHHPASTLLTICIYYRNSSKWEGFWFSCSFHYFFQRRTKMRLLDSVEPRVPCFSRWTSHITALKRAEKCFHSCTHKRSEGLVIILPARHIHFYEFGPQVLVFSFQTCRLPECFPVTEMMKECNRFPGLSGFSTSHRIQMVIGSPCGTCLQARHKLLES